MHAASPGDHHARRKARVLAYSRIVRWMKLALPAGAVVLIGLIFLTGSDRRAVIDVGTADAVALGAGLKLENPRFAGVTDQGDPFVVTARSALPDGPVPDRIDLERPRGEMRLGNGLRLTVTARDGRMFRKAEKLELGGTVELRTSTGYRAVTDRVTLDLATRTAVAPARVRASGPRGNLRADRLRIRQTGDRKGDLTMRFEGNVRLVLKPEPRKTPRPGGR